MTSKQITPDIVDVKSNEAIQDAKDEIARNAEEKALMKLRLQEEGELREREEILEQQRMSRVYTLFSGDTDNKDYFKTNPFYRSRRNAIEDTEAYRKMLNATVRKIHKSHALL